MSWLERKDFPVLYFPAMDTTRMGRLGCFSSHSIASGLHANPSSEEKVTSGITSRGGSKNMATTRFAFLRRCWEGLIRL